LIKINRLSINRNHRIVLDNISLTISKGEFILLTGPSGCGKSTLAYAISGLIPNVIPAETKGDILVNEMNPTETDLPKISQKVGIVFQNPSSQLFHLHVDDEIAFGPRNLGLPESEVQERVQWALEVTNLNKIRHSKPSELSGGQKQCVAIASVLAMRPEILILDEPTASLDIPNSKMVLSILEKLNKEYNTTSLINENGNHKKEDAPILELRHVSAGYNRKEILHDINLRIFSNDFLALVGNNGVGKSTLARVTAGLLKPTKGKVIFQGGKKNRPGLDIALLFQNPTEQLFTDSVDTEIAFGPKNYDQFDKTFHEEILKKADLISLRNRKPFRLSMGQQQRAALAATLSTRPKLIILDEPTLGQDWGHLQKLMDFLVQLNKEGTAILLITHDYKLVHHYSERIYLLSKGTITLKGKIQK